MRFAGCAIIGARAPGGMGMTGMRRGRCAPALAAHQGERARLKVAHRCAAGCRRQGISAAAPCKVNGWERMSSVATKEDVGPVRRRVRATRWKRCRQGEESSAARASPHRSSIRRERCVLVCGCLCRVVRIRKANRCFIVFCLVSSLTGRALQEVPVREVINLLTHPALSPTVGLPTVGHSVPSRLSLFWSRCRSVNSEMFQNWPPNEYRLTSHFCHPRPSTRWFS